MGIIGSTIDRLIDKFEHWRHPKPTTDEQVDGAVDEIRRSADELSMAVARETAALGQLQIKVQQVDIAAAEWHAKAVSAMQRGEEPAARIAVAREREMRVEADAIRKQIDETKARVDLHRRELDRIQHKADDARNKGDDIKNRDGVEDAREKAKDSLDPTKPGSAADRLDKADQDTTAREQARKDREAGDGTATDDTFEDIKRRQELEEMMDRLRREAGGNAPPAPSPAPLPTTPPASPPRLAPPAESWNIAR